MKDLLHVRYFFHILLALTSSFLLILAWFLGEFFLFIGFIPLFILIRSIKTSRNYFQIFLYSYITFSVWNFALVYWLTYISFSGGLVVIIANAFLMALVPVLAIFTDDYSNKNIITSSFLIYWILFEYLHQHWFLAFPWLHLGNAFASLPSWIQWYEYTGVLGGSVWILVTNLLIYKGLYFHRHNFLYAFLWFLLPFLFSLYQFSSYEETGRKVNIVVVQPNFDVYEEKLIGSKNFVPFDQQIEYIHQLILKNTTKKPDLILLPEATLDDFFELTRLKEGLEKHINHLLQILEHFPNTALLAGITTFQFVPKDSIPSPSARYNVNSAVYYEVYNSAVFFQKKQTPQFYHKSKLVIGGEFMPFIEYIGDLTTILGGTTGLVTPQEHRAVFVDAQKNRFAPIICYESAFGTFISEYTEKDAEILCVITNDGYWDGSLEPMQHFQLDRLRCIEQRRSMARAAYTGISGFINQKGEIIEKTEPQIPTALQAVLRTNRHKTFYQKYGDFIGILALISLILLWLSLFWSGKSKKIYSKDLQNNFFP